VSPTGDGYGQTVDSLLGIWYNGAASLTAEQPAQKQFLACSSRGFRTCSFRGDLGRFRPRRESEVKYGFRMRSSQPALDIGVVDSRHQYCGKHGSLL